MCGQADGIRRARGGRRQTTLQKRRKTAVATPMLPSAAQAPQHTAFTSADSTIAALTAVGDSSSEAHPAVSLTVTVLDTVATQDDAHISRTVLLMFY